MKTQETSPLTHYEDAAMFGYTQKPIDNRVYEREVKPGIQWYPIIMGAIITLLAVEFIIIVIAALNGWGM